MNARELEPIRFGEDGLAPAVVQDAITGDVLMLAYMNEEALRLTRATSRAHYWSRGRDRLWRKGETSGHEQIVESISVNCERNSLLLQVRQVGAVCHDGYPTCYYRQIGPDGSLIVVRQRSFDPDEVYGADTTQTAPVHTDEVDALAEATRLQYGAYAYLRDHDLEAESSTSRLLRSKDDAVSARVADELRELAGVLSGEHRHTELESDLRLEASQVIYWVLLAALRDGVTWARLRPDRALVTGEVEVSAPTVARLLQAEADAWRDSKLGRDEIAARAHATLALVSQACRSAGVAPHSVIEADLRELRSRPYLTPYFGPAMT
jgi:phosphoribosyl-AMP cyclohydrolase